MAMLNSFGTNSSMFWKQALEALGFGSAIAFAMMTYAGFLATEKMASAQAIDAFSNWIKNRTFAREDAQAAVNRLFDNVYTNSLFSIKGFIRSSEITITIYVICLPLLYWLLPVMRNDIHNLVALSFIIVASLLSDYVALIIVKRILYISTYIYVSLFAAVLVAIIIIISLNIVFANISGVIQGDDIILHASFVLKTWLLYLTLEMSLSGYLQLIPNIIVILWLPLLGVGVLIVKSLNIFLKGVRWSQWFLKQGDIHPLRAIGLAASTVVLFGAGVVHWFQ
jgi:hypothetical protein